MGSAPITTVFQPDPACFAPSNIWLWEGTCRGTASEDCMYAYHGNPEGRLNRWSRRDSDPCYPDERPEAETTYYSDCPESFTAAASWSDQYRLDGSTFNYDEGVAATTICCPNAYPYFYDRYRSLTSTDAGGQTVEYDLLRKPSCMATSVEVLRSQVVTVTLAAEPELVTTTTTWAADAPLYADAVTVTATQYGGYPAVSTCWGADCPATFTASFPDPPVETPPTTRFAPPPECTDAANLWSVTTSCYITSPQNQYVYTPDWLQCAVTQMGGNEYWVTACEPPAVSNDEGAYYAGCPNGYTPARTSTAAAYDKYTYTEGYYDAIRHEVHCCPDSYDFKVTSDSVYGQDITTSHDGRWYGVRRYALPGCIATSVLALSGKDVPMHTHSAVFGWDKRQEQPDFPVTAAWDYAGGTLFAPIAYATSTVFMGTHTCYEACSTWMSYYYPDRIGGPSPTPTPTPTPTPDAGASGRNTQDPSTGDTGPEASPAPSDATGSGAADEGSPEASSAATDVPASGAPSLAKMKTVGASGMVALVALWLAL